MWRSLWSTVVANVSTLQPLPPVLARLSRLVVCLNCHRHHMAAHAVSQGEIEGLYRRFRALDRGHKVGLLSRTAWCYLLLCCSQQGAQSTVASQQQAFCLRRLALQSLGSCCAIAQAVMHPAGSVGLHLS